MISEHHAAVVPVKQPGAQILLQPCDLLGDSLLGGEQLPCRFGKAQGFCQRKQSANRSFCYHVKSPPSSVILLYRADRESVKGSDHKQLLVTAASDNKRNW